MGYKEDVHANVLGFYAVSGMIYTSIFDSARSPWYINDSPDNKQGQPVQTFRPRWGTVQNFID